MQTACRPISVGAGIKLPVVMPTVSICIPVYNGASYIATAVKSAIDQTYTDTEIVISDNCSTDQTLEVISSFKDPRIRIHRNGHNLGMLGNFNGVVRLARGKYIKLLCADDLLYPRALELQVAAMIDPANEAVALVCSPKDVIGPRGQMLLRRRGIKAPGRYAARDAIRLIFQYAGNPFGEPSCVLFRADAFARTAGFTDRLPYLIDLTLWRELLRHGDVYVVGESTAAFRVSRESATMGFVRQQTRQIRQFLRELAEQESGISRTMLWMALCKAGGIVFTRRLFYSLVT